MTLATTRVFQADANGTQRLVAAAGDEYTGSVAPSPPGITKGPADYDSTPSYDVLKTRNPAISTIGNDGVPVIGRVETAGTVVGVTYAPDTTITGADTHYRRFRVVNRGTDGTGTTIVAELSFVSGVNATGSDEKVITLSATAANLVVGAGDVLRLESTHIGNGIADPGGLVRVEIDPS